LIQKKAEHTQNALLLAQQIFRELFTDKGFCNLLKVEKFTSIPQPLAELSSRSRMQR
jgi:ParB family chromosome partitioning protein